MKIKNLIWAFPLLFAGFFLIASCANEGGDQAEGDAQEQMMDEAGHEGHDHGDHADHDHDAEAGDEASMEEGDMDKSGPEYTSRYICPMHCEGSGSDEPGECPVCGMAYEENPDYEESKEM